MGWFLRREEQQSTPGMSLRDMDALHKKKNSLGLGEGLSNILR